MIQNYKQYQAPWIMEAAFSILFKYNFSTGVNFEQMT